MLGISQLYQGKFSSDSDMNIRAAPSRTARWTQLAQSTVFVLGSPRSGTTWLAKIFDSHPDILYRHEPDERRQPRPGLSPADQIGEWLSTRGLSVSSKRPHFRKSWRPRSRDAARRALIAMLAASRRLTRTAEAIPVPDLIPPRRWNGVRPVLKLVNWDPTGSALILPNARYVFIVRHPCGQVASTLAGIATNRFRPAPNQAGGIGDASDAAHYACRCGVSAGEFRALPDAAKCAWAWRAFNETVMTGLRGLPNTKTIIYEELCRDPYTLARDLFAFANLDWPDQTDEFLRLSTHTDRSTAYFDVFRDTPKVADRWRRTLTRQDQQAVRGVVSTSPLAPLWSDLGVKNR